MSYTDFFQKVSNKVFSSDVPIYVFCKGGKVLISKKSDRALIDYMIGAYQRSKDIPWDLMEKCIYEDLSYADFMYGSAE